MKLHKNDYCWFLCVGLQKDPHGLVRTYNAVANRACRGSYRGKKKNEQKVCLIPLKRHTVYQVSCMWVWNGIFLSITFPSVIRHCTNRASDHNTLSHSPIEVCVSHQGSRMCVQAVVTVRCVSRGQGFVVFVPVVSGRGHTQFVLAVKLHSWATEHSFRDLTRWGMRRHCNTRTHA